MKLLAFGASTSSTSINRRLAHHTAAQVAGGEVTRLDLRDLPVPLYSVDLEESEGHPHNARRFVELIGSHDGLVVSLAEHNGAYSAAFKSLFDWATRIEQKVWQNKPMLLLSTSPGGRGGAAVMAAAQASFPHLGGDLVATFSLPSFGDNFSDDGGITDDRLAADHRAAVEAFAKALAGS